MRRRHRQSLELATPPRDPFNSVHHESAASFAEEEPATRAPIPWNRQIERVRIPSIQAGQSERRVPGQECVRAGVQYRRPGALPLGRPA
jgi:hypothetical protein